MPAVATIIRKASSNRGLAVALLVGAVALLLFVISNFGPAKLALPPLTDRRDATRQLVPVGKIEKLSTNFASIRMQPFTNGNHPFFTLHFKPPPPPVVIVPEPVPAPPPPPPPPEMKKVNLLYRGVYRSSDGTQKAFLLIDTNLSVMPVGANVAGDWSISEIGLQKLALTNAASQTNILEFSRARELEIPVIKP